VVIFWVLLRKIKKITTHSLFYFAAEGGEILLRQPRKEIFRMHGGPVARRASFQWPIGTGKTADRIFLDNLQWKLWWLPPQPG
jgi:hypothetical protein